MTRGRQRTNNARRESNTTFDGHWLIIPAKG